VSELYRFTPQWSARLTASWQDGKVDTYSSSAAAEKRRESISRLMPPTAECGLRWQSDPRSEYWCELVGSAADKADKLSADDRLDTQRIPPGGTPGYVVCHVRGGARLTDALTLNMAVENVFDEDYRIHGSGVNEPGRNVILTAMCEF
jgi:hemoglobin/transferrin/lactoferrin receptor protein